MTQRSEKIRTIIYNTAVCAAVGVGVFFLAQLLAGSLIYRVFIVMDMREMPVYYRNSFLILPETAALLAILYFLRRFLVKIPACALFTGLSLLWLAAGLYIIFRTEPYLHSDPFMIFKYVLRFNEGDYSGFEKGFYMNMFPYQLGFLTYERFLSVISTDLRLYYFANLVLVLLAAFYQWRAARLLFEDNDLAVKYTIVLSFLFLPLLFSIMWMYGQIPGFSFLCGAFLFLVRYLRGKGWWNILICALFSAISYQMKMNYMIGVIAMAIILVLYFIRPPVPSESGSAGSAGKNSSIAGIKAGLVRYIVPIVLLFAVVIGGNKAVRGYYKNVSGYDFGNGTPYMSYLAMGLQESGNTRAPGWYNGYVFDLYLDNDSDANIASQLSKEYIKGRLPEFAANPTYTYRFFRDKITAAWCDPMFQSVWSGPIPDEGSDRTSDPILRNIYKGGRLYEILEAFMNALNVLIYACSLVFCGWTLKAVFSKPCSGDAAASAAPAQKTGSAGAGGAEPAILFYMIYFIGGFIFHGISEAKGQYSYMYVYSLIPLAAYVLAYLFSRQKRS